MTNRKEGGRGAEFNHRLIRAMCSARGLTLDELAGEAGVSHATVSRIVNGYPNVLLTSLSKVLGALGMSMQDACNFAADDEAIIACLTAAVKKGGA